MDARTKKFIGSAFGPDYVNEPEVLKEGIQRSLADPGPFSKASEAQRDGFAEVIRTRGLSLAEWEDLTEGVLSFSGEDDLYAYLEKAYDYFFGDAAELPPHPGD
ncbi:hypothetical protein ABZ725_07070 [Streptomyces sp. NPDC006872]|uniref:hypothetical protein n=1 Tax=Streptomyces sp. NPDC006872 TaxID=3155720 RepID=UPI0033DB51A0